MSWDKSRTHALYCRWQPVRYDLENVQACSCAALPIGPGTCEARRTVPGLPRRWTRLDQGQDMLAC